jgi:hypothetical protein
MLAPIDREIKVAIAFLHFAAGAETGQRKRLTRPYFSGEDSSVTEPFHHSRLRPLTSSSTMRLAVRDAGPLQSSIHRSNANVR